MLNAYYQRPELWERDIYTTGYERDRMIAAVDLIPPEIRTLLDVGCGNGAFISFVERMRPEIAASGLEPSQAAIDKKVCHSPIVQGDVMSLPFSSLTFDMVCSMAVLEHIPTSEIPRATQEIMRVTRNNILVDLPYKERRVRIRCPECGCGFDPHLHLRSYSDRQIDDLFPAWSLVKKQVLTGKESLLPYLLLRILRKEIDASRFPKAVCPQCNRHSRAHSAVGATSSRKGYLRWLWEMQPSISIEREIMVLFSLQQARCA